MTDPVGLGYVFFRTADPRLRHQKSLTCLLGPKVPTPVYTPGYEITSRPRKVGMTTWQGRDPLRLQFDIIIDHHSDAYKTVPGVRTEKECRELEEIAGAWNPGSEPYKFSFDTGGVVPHDATHNRKLLWVIEEITWGDATRLHNGRRVRQQADLTLLHYVDTDVLESLQSAASKWKDDPKTPSKSKIGLYVVQEGDTLPKIAAKIYKDHGGRKKWKVIARANGLHSPSARIQPGRVLKYPLNGAWDPEPLGAIKAV